MSPRPGSYYADVRIDADLVAAYVRQNQPSDEALRAFVLGETAPYAAAIAIRIREDQRKNTGAFHD